VSATIDPIETLNDRPDADQLDADQLDADQLDVEDLHQMAVPPVPGSIEETGIASAVYEQLILKYLYFRGELAGREIAKLAGLPFSLIDKMLEMQKHQHLVAVKKSLGIGNSSASFTLTESGRILAREFLENNQYAGPAPVPLYQYTEMVRLQKLRDHWLTPDLLEKAFRHLVVERDILAQIGPAVNSSKSFLIYGQPGNGKTALAEALFRVETEPIYMPFALECQGNIIQIYDPIYHQKIEDEESALTALSIDKAHDGRWFKCPRPFIVSGGELTLDMLDLCYNSHSKVYDAPFQLKANNGIYLIDDFGRQKATPTEVLNRWILPMERHIDYLTFQAGGKMTVPFEAFIIFSTNLNPHQLGDEAFLRRIQYKMFLRSPKAPEFIKIFERYAAKCELLCPPSLPERFVEKHYASGAQPFRRCHPRDVINHAVDILNFERRPMELTEEVLDRAFHSCFIESSNVND
jgi:hypothetical protein